MSEVDNSSVETADSTFSEESWEMISSFIEKLPEPVKLIVWGEAAACIGVSTVDLCRTIADRFDILSFESRPEVENYRYHPIIGFMGIDKDGNEIDHRIRLMGHPQGVQINSMIAAIQAASFQGTMMEAKTRFQLKGLKKDVSFELFTAPNDEGGVTMASLLCNLTVLHPQIRLMITMINDFPQLATQYSVYSLPHTIMNGRHHFQGVYDQDKFLQLMAKALKD
ncbi:MAG: hypothetical protein AAF633_11280 [Chloroflexota bacterium]